jgi:DNA primase
MLDAAEPLAEVLWRMETAGKPVDTPERRASIDKRLDDRARQIADRTVQNYYRRYFRSRLWEAFSDYQPVLRGRRGAPRGLRSGAGIGRADRLGQGAEGRAWHRERVLVTTVLNQPALIGEIAEDFAAMAIEDPELDSLRQAILEISAADPGLDVEALKLHLTQRGFSQTVDRLAGFVTNVLDWFSNPGAAPEDALMGWRHMLPRHRRLGALMAELKAVEEALGRNPTEEVWARFEALKRMLDEGAGDEAEIEGYGVASGRPLGL